MRSTRLPLAALLAALLVPPATAQEFAALRPLVVVDDPMLRLGDLFEGAGARADRAVGAAPAPGRRFVLEATQLAAVARAHGLAWRPLTANERSVVERPGRPVARDAIEAALRDALVPAGLDPDAALDLGAFVPPMVPTTGTPLVTAETPALETTGRFAATLVVLADGMPTLRQRIAGRALPTAAAVVATRRLGPGDIVRAADVRLLRLRAERVPAGAADRLDQVVGLQLRRAVAIDQPFVAQELAAPAMVERNMLVTLLLEAPGLSLSAQGRALAAAPRGGIVSVMNLASNTVVEGQVVAPGRVRVAGGDR